MGNHPVLPQRAHHPRFLTKSSGSIATERQPIPDQRNEEEVAGSLPVLEREHGSGEKYQGEGLQIAYSPTGTAPPAVRRTEHKNTKDHLGQSRRHKDNGRPTKEKRGPKSEHSFTL